jgi:hypothetical protein
MIMGITKSFFGRFYSHTKSMSPMGDVSLKSLGFDYYWRPLDDEDATASGALLLKSSFNCSLFCKCLINWALSCLSYYSSANRYELLVIISALYSTCDRLISPSLKLCSLTSTSLNISRTLFKSRSLRSFILLTMSSCITKFEYLIHVFSFANALSGLVQQSHTLVMLLLNVHIDILQLFLQQLHTARGFRALYIFLDLSQNGLLLAYAQAFNSFLQGPFYAWSFHWRLWRLLR